MEIFTLIVASVIIGFVVGILSGLLGIGGGTILVPTFRLGFAMAPLACTATSLFTIIPTSVSGAITHIKRKTCVPRIGVAAGLGGAIMSPVGVWLASISPDWGCMVAAAVVIAYSAYTMLRKAIRMGDAKSVASDTTGAASVEVAGDIGESDIGESEADANGLGGNEAAATIEKTTKNAPPEPTYGLRALLIAASIGLVAGVMSGYVGVGGGFIMVPMMISLLNMPMKKTSGTSLIGVMILAIPGVIIQAIYGNVHWLAGIFVAVGSIPGAIVGARLIEKIPEHTLRFAFSGFLFLAAVLLILNQLSVF